MTRMLPIEHARINPLEQRSVTFMRKMFFFLHFFICNGKFTQISVSLDIIIVSLKNATDFPGDVAAFSFNTVIQEIIYMCLTL